MIWGFPQKWGDPCSSSICKSFFPYQHISTIQLLGYPDFGNPQMVFWDDFPNVKTIRASKSWTERFFHLHQNGIFPPIFGARRYGTILWCQSVLRVHWKMIGCHLTGPEKPWLGGKKHRKKIPRRTAVCRAIVGSWHTRFFPHR